MVVDTFEEIWKRVAAQAPGIGALEAQRFTIDAFRRIAERRCWSWLIKYNQFIFPALYNTGTVSVTQNSTTVTGSGTSWDVSMVGRQFRIGNSTPIYTITQVTSATSLELEIPWGGTTQSGVVYQIYLCYASPPSDFHAFISVWDPNFNWQLWRNVTQQELNSWDAQRANTGQAWVVAARDYSSVTTGTINAPVQIVGTGPSPAIAGDATYVGAADALFIVTVTTGGAADSAVFKWSKGSSTYTTGVTTASAGQELQDGVTIYWPTGVTYVLNDTWVIRVSVANSPGVPRYEFWPHVQSNYVFPYLYESRAMDLNEAGAVLPRFIRGDVVMDVALSNAARWPGASVDKPNPYYDLALADRIEARCEKSLGELERQDDETYEAMVKYAANMDYAPWMDARFLQNHAY